MSTSNAIGTVRVADEVRFSQLKQLSIEVNPENRSLWGFMNPAPRACMNRELLRELREFQAILIQHQGRPS